MDGYKKLRAKWHTKWRTGHMYDLRDMDEDNAQILVTTYTESRAMAQQVGRELVWEIAVECTIDPCYAESGKVVLDEDEWTYMTTKISQIIREHKEQERLVAMLKASADMQTVVAKRLALVLDLVCQRKQMEEIHEGKDLQ